MADDSVLYEKRGHVSWITINRPEKMNAVDRATNVELSHAWEKYEGDEDAWVVVITGAGERSFCAGADLNAARPGPTDEPPDDIRSPLSLGGGLTGVAGRRINVTKPIIAAVNGYALGGGFELALASDIIVATESAQFGIPEGLVGSIAGAGVVHRAPRQLPLKVAMSMILTGRRMDAHEALRLGLVSELAEDRERLMALAEKWANDVLRCSPLYARAVKAAVTSRLGWPLDIALETRYELIDQMGRSQDSREGTAAFRDRRAPKWIGR